MLRLQKIHSSEGRSGTDYEAYAEGRWQRSSENSMTVQNGNQTTSFGMELSHTGKVPLTSELR